MKGKPIPIGPITVYTKPNCPQCGATIRALHKLGIPHTTVDITENSDARD